MTADARRPRPQVLHPGAGRLELACSACGWSRTYDAGRIVQRLQARGFGGPGALAPEVARHVQWPCPYCGRMRWRTRLESAAQRSS